MNRAYINQHLAEAELHYAKAKRASSPEIAAIHNELGDHQLAVAQAKHEALKAAARNPEPKAAWQR